MMRAQEFQEVQLLTRVKGKGEEPSNLPKYGRPILPKEEITYLGKKIGNMGRYEIWRDYVGSQVSYILVDPESRRAIIHAFGSRYQRNPNSFIVAGLYAAPGNPVRASQFYHALITELGLDIISDIKQSPGGYKVWRELERRFRDVTVYGYDTKRNELLNVTARDEEMTHVPAEIVRKGGPDVKDVARNIRLVATAR
jgi:hypothetical protein